MLRWLMIGLVLAVSLTTVSFARAEGYATAFHYGPKPDVALFAHFDRVVLEPDHFATRPASPRAELYAYVSVGEVSRTRAWYKDVPPGLVLATNGGWNSDIIDTRRAEWRAFLLDKVIEPLWAKGWRAFFLDTLDSYERTTTDVSAREAHARGIAAFVTALRQRHPDARILFNRGFDALDALGGSVHIDGLVAESLLETWDPNDHRYRAMTPDETRALERRLDDVKGRLRLPIAVIDYVPASQPERRRDTARRILRMGYEPWVTSFDLTSTGVGSVEILPRRIEVLYKGTPTASLVAHDAVVLLGPVLDYLGYVVDYVDVRQPLPTEDLTGQVAGVIVFVPEGADDEGRLRRWVVTQMDRGIRVAFVEGFGFDMDAALLARLGLAAGRSTVTAPLGIGQTTDYFGFEAPVRTHLHERPPVLALDASQSLLRLTDANGGVWDAGVIGPWGGAVFAPYMLEEGLEEERRWILDPFRFFTAALALPPMPVPDVTTEAGRRILTVHVDGDAFVSHAERRDAAFCGQVILDEVLKKYALPHTISIIEGEIGPKGIYPQDSPKLEAIAKAIFAMPNVELGTHLYSHPFEWHEAEAGSRGPPLPFLPVPNYTFNLDREIKGSIDYINQRLAPPNKRVKIAQWTGDCLPSAQAVGASVASGVLNVNGGGATRVNDTPSLTRGSGIGARLGPNAYQVFAPVENENVYTNDWRGPFYGYRHAIQTFELNDKPRRLSTITLYYHFYSAAKTASMEALHEVYKWALSQETTPLFMSEYATKVLAFQKATVARRVDGGAWEIADYGDVRTVRLPATLGWPNLRESNRVAGVRDVPQGRYVHLAPGPRAYLALTSAAPTTPYLHDANGTVASWTPTEHGAELRVVGHVPLSITIGGVGAGSCTLTPRGGAPIAGRKAGALVSFALPATDTTEATLDCR